MKSLNIKIWMNVRDRAWAECCTCLGVVHVDIGLALKDSVEIARTWQVRDNVWWQIKAQCWREGLGEIS